MVVGGSLCRSWHRLWGVGALARCPSRFLSQVCSCPRALVLSLYLCRVVSLSLSLFLYLSCFTSFISLPLTQREDPPCAISPRETRVKSRRWSGPGFAEFRHFDGMCRKLTKCGHSLRKVAQHACGNGTLRFRSDFLQPVPSPVGLGTGGRK